MGIELIHHENPLGLRVGLDGPPDMFDKIVFGTCLADRGSNHHARGDFEIGDQGLSSVPYVFEFRPFRLAWLHGERGV